MSDSFDVSDIESWYYGLDQEVVDDMLEGSWRLHLREQIAAELTGDPNDLHNVPIEVSSLEEFVKVTTPSPGYDNPAGEEFGRRMLGSMMVRTGAAILLVPDPFEPVSAPFAAFLVIGGVALHASTW